MKVYVQNGDEYDTYFFRFHYPHSRRHLKNQTTVYCEIAKKTDDENKIINVGRALCKPPDVFDKRFGRKLAFTHAIEVLPRETRKLFWEEYNRTVILPGFESPLTKDK